MQIECYNNYGIQNLPTIIPASATGRLRVQVDGSQLFYDAYDFGVIDTLINWLNTGTTSGSANITASQGNLAFYSGSTANSYGYLLSKQKFSPTSPGFLEFNFQTQFVNPIPANTYSFFGVGNIPATPTVQNPVTDGVGFELCPAGIFQTTPGGGFNCVSWAGGTRNVIPPINFVANPQSPVIPPITFPNGTQFLSPNDGNVHRYQIYLRGDTIYWVVDNITVAQIFTGALGPNTNLLPIVHLVGVTGSGASSGLLLNSAACYVGDSTRTQYRQIASSSGGPIPKWFQSDGSTTVATNIKSSFGQVWSVSVANSAASDMYLHLVDKATTPVPSSDSSLIREIIPIKASGNVPSSPMYTIGDQYFNGIGFWVATAIAGTNAPAAGGAWKISVR